MVVVAVVVVISNPLDPITMIKTPAFGCLVSQCFPGNVASRCSGFGQYNNQEQNNQDGNNIVVCYCYCLLVVVISILFIVGWPNPVGVPTSTQLRLRCIPKQPYVMADPSIRYDLSQDSVDACCIA